MTFRGKRLDQLEVADLQGLIGSARESRTIDFKRDLPEQAPSDRKEFLADVSSFANSAGGHIIFGIREENGVPTELSGLAVDDPKRPIQEERTR